MTWQMVGFVIQLLFFVVLAGLWVWRWLLPYAWCDYIAFIREARDSGRYVCKRDFIKVIRRMENGREVKFVKFFFNQSREEEISLTSIRPPEPGLLNTIFKKETVYFWRDKNKKYHVIGFNPNTFEETVEPEHHDISLWAHQMRNITQEEFNKKDNFWAKMMPFVGITACMMVAIIAIIIVYMMTKDASGAMQKAVSQASSSLQAVKFGV